MSILSVNDIKWDKRFLLLAAHTASWSKDPSTQTGAVITDRNRRIISVGYNGMPQGVEDSFERLHNRELKYQTIVHCERNAIIFAQRDLSGCTLYTWPFLSCSVCAAMVIQSGITRVVAPINTNPRWTESFKLSTELFHEAEVDISLYDMNEIDELHLNPPPQVENPLEWNNFVAAPLPEKFPWYKRFLSWFSYIPPMG